jgi:hypothetical protein
MHKFALTLVAIVSLATGCAISGFAIAETYQQYTHPSSPYAPMPFGDQGTPFSRVCWVDMSVGSYFGYWAPCLPPQPDQRARAN